ncbi:MAG: ABC transporter permease [Verrucomicrobiales bacterium]|jgi:phospholipid/cholesterol/gamma-HCH transport system permease protein|nr:ABC transporter permease [Verrucomicrobiales bacterium]
MSYTRWVGSRLIRALTSLRGVVSFGLITCGVLITKGRTASNVIYPLIWQQVMRSGVALLPMVLFLAVALGLVVIGQTVSLATQVGARQYLGMVMVTVVVRELGPLLAALIVLARAGTGTVIELGTARASREVEALELIGIDPIHYFVVPRIIGMALGVFCLTVYMIVVALLAGYLWAFVQNVPILPSDYFNQLAGALHPLDFVALGLKSTGMGVLIALVTCYHGLAQPLHIEDVSKATIRAITQSVVLCVMADALFLIIYLLL